MKEFFKKLFGFSLGPIIGAIIGFITVPVTSHLIAPDQFGLASMFNLANSIITLVVLIGIDQAYIREYNECNNKKKLLFNSIIIPFIGTIVISTILIAFKDKFAIMLFNNSTLVKPIVLLAVCSPLFIIEKFLLLSIRMEEKALKYSLWNILSKLLNLICLIILLLFYKRNFESVVYATILSQFLISITLCFVCRRNINISRKNFDKKQIIKILKFGLPLVPATLIGYGLNSMDVIFLRGISTYTELGYYSVTLRITNLLTILQTSFTAFWAPVAFKWKAEKVDNKRYEMVSKGVALTMSVTLLLILSVKDFIPIIINKEYIKVIYILPFLLFHPIFYTMSETTTLGISFSRKTGYNIIVSMVSIIVNLILNALLIPIYGAIGAAIATGVSYLVFFWTRTIISRKLWYKFKIKHFVLNSIILVITTICNTMMKNILYTIIINILSIILIIYIYKDVMQAIIKTKRQKNGKILKIGLICFDTQKEQLKNMLQSDNIQIIELNYQGKNKLEKLYFILTKMLKIDIVYFGYGCCRVDSYLKIAKIYKKKVICHWIGSDVLRAKSTKNLKHIQKYINYNLACSPMIKDELKELEIKADEIPVLPINISEDYSKLPDKHGVIMYLPKGKEEFYGIQYLKYAAETFNDIEFYIVGNDNDTINLRNVHFLGKISKSEMNELYDRTNILIRLPQHDGLSLMLLEALIKGKEVIYCYDFPFTKHVTNNKQLYNAISDIISKPPKYNEDGHQYVLEKYKLNEVKEKINSILSNIIN